jgi:uncharacterized protein YlxP (DUF503 family)
MVVGVCRVTLMVEGSHSLKEKRMALRRIKDRTRQKFNVAIAEVADQDAWQQAVLGISMVANDKAFCDEVLKKVVTFIEELAVAKVTDDETDFVQYGDDEAIGEFQHWEPEE